MQSNQSVPIINKRVTGWLQNSLPSIEQLKQGLNFSSKTRAFANISARNATAIAPTAIAP